MLRRRDELTRNKGDTVAFSARYAHDLANHSDRPALTVNAYAPPLGLITYYDVVGTRLVDLASASPTDVAGAPSISSHS